MPSKNKKPPANTRNVSPPRNAITAIPDTMLTPNPTNDTKRIIQPKVYNNGQEQLSVNECPVRLKLKGKASFSAP